MGLLQQLFKPMLNANQGRDERNNVTKYHVPKKLAKKLRKISRASRKKNRR